LARAGHVGSPVASVSLDDGAVSAVLGLGTARAQKGDGLQAQFCV